MRSRGGTMAGFFVITLVVILLMLVSLSMLGLYQIALSQWFALDLATSPAPS